MVQEHRTQRFHLDAASGKLLPLPDPAAGDPAADDPAADEPLTSTVPLGPPAPAHLTDAAAPDAAPPPTGYARYRDFLVLGTGGTGTVKSCVDPQLGRRLALKLLNPRHRHDPDTRERFLREARIMAQLEHPNIMPVHELGVDASGRAYFTMKLVRGVTLRTVLVDLLAGDRGALDAYPLPRLLEVFLNVCEGVAFAHSRGVIHRDLKPDNIMIGEYGEVLVLDWGLAKVVGPEPPSAPDSAAPDSAAPDSAAPDSAAPDSAAPDSAALRLPSSVQTEAGSIAGTPAYMAPEQVSGDVAHHDERTDLYSLGVILYEILTWRRPFAGPTIKDLMAAIVSGRLVPPRQAAPRRRIPRELEAICLKALACRREDRYANVQELIDDLACYRDEFPIAALPPSPLRRLAKFGHRHLVASATVGAVLAVLLIGGLAYGVRAVDHYYSLAARADAYRVRGTAALRQEREVLANLQAARAAAARDVMTPAELALESRLAQLHRQRESAYESAVVLYLTAAGDAAGSARLRQGLIEIYSNRIRYALATENYGEAGYWLDFLKTWAGQDYRRVPPMDRTRLDRLAHEVAGDATLAVASQPAGAAVTLWQLRPGANGVWVPAEPTALGHTPLAPVAVAKGSYLLTFIRPERPEVRCPVFVKHGERLSVAPYLPRQIPEGLAYVPAGRFYAGPRPANGGGLRERQAAGFFMKIHEVTFREYLRFWLDPAGGRQQPRLVSRLSFNLEERRLDDAWDGQGRLLPPLTPDLPVVGVTHAAAVAYCEWLSRSTGMPCRLPTADEWEKAARGVDGREYVWGDRFDPAFSLTRDTPAALARPTAWAPPGSFPTDCSVYGIWDLVGNAREWTSSPLPSGEPGYQIRGTSVMTTGHRALHVYDADDSPMATYDVGFRYVMTVAADIGD